MPNKTAIEWSEFSWNPTGGCDRISPGCDRCYALTMAARLKKMGSARYQNDGDPVTSGPGFGLTMHPDLLDWPLTKRKPSVFFVNSMSDLFHKDVTDGFIGSVFNTMAVAERHTFQVLTKRPQRMARLLTAMGDAGSFRNHRDRWVQPPVWPLPNVWMGTSIESDTYTFRADHLRNTPAATRFLSLEPLLGPLPSLDLTGISWVIVGGESGPGARPMHPDWVRDIRDRCIAAGVPFLFKQWGAWVEPLPASGFSPDDRHWPNHTVEWVDGEGRFRDTNELGTFTPPRDWRRMVRMDKKVAGRTLDGRLWDQYPPHHSTLLTNTLKDEPQ